MSGGFAVSSLVGFLGVYINYINIDHVSPRPITPEDLVGSKGVRFTPGQQEPAEVSFGLLFCRVVDPLHPAARLNPGHPPPQVWQEAGQGGGGQSWAQEEQGQGGWRNDLM